MWDNRIQGKTRIGTSFPYQRTTARVAADETANLDRMGCHIGMIYFTRRLYERYKISIRSTLQGIRKMAIPLCLEI